MVEYSYVSVEGESHDSFAEKKSRFIGYIKDIESEEEAQEYIAHVKKLHRDSSHCVFAYVLRDGQTRRYSDDGEPQGTAGIPTLDVITREGLVDVCIVGVRYFGGILLGAGGLVRAYSHTAKLAVDSAQRKNMYMTSRLCATVPYTMFGKISSELPKLGVKIETPIFSDTVSLNLVMKKENRDKTIDFLTDVCSGNARIEDLGDDYSRWE